MDRKSLSSDLEDLTVRDNVCHTYLATPIVYYGKQVIFLIKIVYSISKQTNWKANSAAMPLINYNSGLLLAIRDANYWMLFLSSSLKGSNQPINTLFVVVTRWVYILLTFVYSLHHWYYLFLLQVFCFINISLAFVL